MTAQQCYKAYRQKKEIQRKIESRRFKRRILKYRGSIPNPKTGGWFVSNNGSPDNSGRRFDEPIDPQTYLELEIEDNDRVYFEAGQIYNVGGKQISATNITYGRFGTGADPIHGGSNEDISSLTWTAVGGDVYSTPMAEEPLWIVINNICAKMAETSRINITSRPNTTSTTISHGAVSGYTSIVDSYVVSKDTPFSQSYRVKVTAYNGAGLISHDAPINLNNNVDLVLQNKREYFTGNGQWAWESGVLYVRAAASPSTLNIRMIVHAYGIKTTGVLTVKNIEFKEYYTAAIWSTSTELLAPKLVVQDCYLHDDRDCAILIEREGTGSNISGNVFERHGNNAIHSGPCTNSFYNDNNFLDTGMQANYGFQTWNAGTGITAVVGCAIAYTRDRYAGNVLSVELDGANCQFNGNIIINSAYCGMNVSIGTDHEAAYNDISDYTNRFSDGGGVYTFHFRATNLFNENFHIHHNIIRNDNNPDIAAGIYLDNRTRLSNVHHNTIENVEWGILFNTDTSDHTAENNVSINCIYSYVYRQVDNGTLLIPVNEGNVFNNNLAVAYTSQKCLFFDTNGGYPTWNPYDNGGEADNNEYVATTTAIADSDVDGNNLTLATLRTALGQDANSISRVETSRLFLYNATNAPVAGNAGPGYQTAAGVETDAYTIQPFESIVLFPIPGGSYNSQSLQLVAANSQYVNVGTHADIQYDQTALFTKVMWFKVASNPAAVVTFIDNRDGSGRGNCSQMLTTGGMQEQMVNTVTTNRLQSVSNVDYADGNWHCLQVSKTGTGVNTLVTKIDNTQLSPTISNNLTATILSTANILFGVNSIGTVFLNGLICQIAYWNTNQNFNSTVIYNNGKTHNMMLMSNPPDHYWPLNGDYQDIGSSANKLHGTAFGSPTFSTDVP